MELLLNIVWFLVSFSLVLGWLKTSKSAKFEWPVVLALALLIVLLFPAISMTDDLVAMSAPTEVEHMLRRGEDSSHHGASLSWLDAVATIVMIGVLGSASPLRYFRRVLPRAFAAQLLSITVRIFGVRPPPLTLLAA